MASPCAFQGTNITEWARTDMFGDTRSCFSVCIHRPQRMSPSPAKWKPILVFPWLLLDSSVSPRFRLNLLQKRCASDWKSVTFCFQVLHLLSPAHFLHFILEKNGFFFPLAFCSTRAEEFILFQYHFMLNFQLKSWKYLFYYIGLIWCFAP